MKHVPLLSDANSQSEVHISPGSVHVLVVLLRERGIPQSELLGQNVHSLRRGLQVWLKCLLLGVS